VNDLHNAIRNELAEQRQALDDVWRLLPEADLDTLAAARLLVRLADVGAEMEKVAELVRQAASSGPQTAA
jgi:hypothetical protein